MATKGDKTNYFYKLFRVKRSDGRVTTVSVDPVLVTRACQVMGGLKPVAKLVREAAYAYEPSVGEKTCSGYCQNQIRAIVSNRVPRAVEQQAPAMA
jgi:hypothetical protein